MQCVSVKTIEINRCEWETVSTMSMKQCHMMLWLMKRNEIITMHDG